MLSQPGAADRSSTTAAGRRWSLAEPYSRLAYRGAGKKDVNAGRGDSASFEIRSRIRQPVISCPTSIAKQARPPPAARQPGGIAMKETTLTAVAVGFALMLAANVAASGAEIAVISSNALKTTLEELAPAFEKATEHKLVFTWGAAVPLRA